MQQDGERFKRRTGHVVCNLKMEKGIQSGTSAFEERLQTDSQGEKGKVCFVTTSNWILLIT